MSAAQTAKNLLLGSVSTAIITVRDFREKAKRLELGQYAPKIDFSPEIPKPELEKIVETIESGDKAATELLLESSEYKKRQYKVQFNPKELILSGQQPVSTNGSVEGTGKDSPVSNSVAHEPAKVSLTMNLVFDEVNLFDCFTCEKFTPGVANLTKNLVTAGMKLKGTVWSVRPQVEAFLAAVRNPYTRLIEFTWEKFTFVGNIAQISAEYTMFSIEGHPVRANMRLMLVNEKNNAESQRWIRDFDNAFKGSSGNLVTADGYVGNVLNMGAFGL
ncbi:MAG: hypothetical protein FWG44_02220 [Oscillospiraceae bacterium]|nr:hypothetical protein [Oscillospiraceae bacterium]